MFKITIHGITMGIVMWILIKIIDIENKNNKLVKNIIIGCITSGLFNVPFPFIGIIIGVLILAALFNHYELSFGEGAIIVVVVGIVDFLLGLATSRLVIFK